MSELPPENEPVSHETNDIKTRLEETEETLHAIRQYLVDAFVVNRESDTQVVTLADAEFPYRMMVEEMNEGAVTLIPDGTILYCNHRFSEIVQIESEALIGSKFQDLILGEEMEAFESLFQKVRSEELGGKGVREKFCIQVRDGPCVPVQFSFYLIKTQGATGISLLVTDIRERVKAEARIRTLASKLTMAEQEERHRISEVLHDDLQQSLFAVKTLLTLLHDSDEARQLPQSLQDVLTQSLDWLSDAIVTTRNLSVDMSPAILQGEGLAQAIEWLALQMHERYDLQVTLDLQENITGLPTDMRVLLFQAIREILFNTVKHAGTSQASITLSQTPTHGRISISDMGKGFDVSVLNHPSTTHGLALIRERLELVGGTLTITSSSGEGTQAVIEVPQGNTHPLNESESQRESERPPENDRLNGF